MTFRLPSPLPPRSSTPTQEHERHPYPDDGHLDDPASLHKRSITSLGLEAPFCSLLLLTLPVQFFTRLTSLFLSHTHSTPSSIYLTQKRLSHPPSSNHDSSSAPSPSLSPSQTPLLIRASNGAPPKSRRAGHKIKFSCIVPADELERFFTRYMEVLKEGAVAKGGLKKRDKGGKKAKERREVRRRQKENKKKGWPEGDDRRKKKKKSNVEGKSKG